MQRVNKQTDTSKTATSAFAFNRLSESELTSFLSNGFVGPFPCLSPSLDHLDIPNDPKYRARHMLNHHETNQDVYNICSHPSIVEKAKQIFGGNGVALFKSRYWLKPAGSSKVAPWHQDVGNRNGGYEKNGCPVPSITVWLALDKATPENGGLKIIPKSHQKLVGNWRDNIHAGLNPKDLVNSQVKDLIVNPGEFYIIHSWLLHSSEKNNSTQDRSAMNIRYCSGISNKEQDGKYTLLCHEDNTIDSALREQRMRELAHAWHSNNC